MYGFRELGAEIVPYHFIDEIEEKIGLKDIVLDYIEQCQWVFKEFGHPTYMDCYPEILKPFLKRKILATYSFARMKKLMEEEFPSFEDDDYAHMASVQITVLVDMLQSGILSYNDLYQETLEVIEQLLG